MEYGLDAEQINILQKIFEKYQSIETVIIYGSRAKGNFTDRSDIDLVFKSDTNNRFDLANIGNDIDDTLIPYKVDLQFYDDILNVKLKEHIDHVGKIFYKKS